MREHKCSFCGRKFELGTGTQAAKNDGTVFHFCSSKCRKNQALGRSPIHTLWTQRFRDFKDEAKGEKKKKTTLVEKVAEKVAIKKKVKAKKTSKRKERKKLARKKK